MALLSDETLTFITRKAQSMHHGTITIHINSDAASKVDIEVCERQRFHTDDVVEKPQTPPRPIPGGRDPVGASRRG